MFMYMLFILFYVCGCKWPKGLNDFNFTIKLCLQNGGDGIFKCVTSGKKDFLKSLAHSMDFFLCVNPWRAGTFNFSNTWCCFLKLKQMSTHPHRCVLHTMPY